MYVDHLGLKQTVFGSHNLYDSIMLSGSITIVTVKVDKSTMEVYTYI